MAGLREKQKAKRNRAILKAASALFGQSGYEAVRIEAIAERAEVSVGTFYNYFETKADLLLAIVSMEVEEVLNQGEEVLANPPASPQDALCALISVYYDHSLVYLTKEMWRTAMALAIQHPETPFSKRYRGLDAALSDQVVALVCSLQSRGAIREEARPQRLGEMIFLCLNGHFMAFTTSETMSLSTLKETVFAQVHEVMQFFDHSDDRADA